MGDKVAQSFGGDVHYENGEWTSPTFKIKTVNGEGEEKEDTYKNVSDALTGIGTSITNVQNKVTEQINNVVSQVAANSFVQQDDTTKRITIGAKEEGREINIANKSGGDRTLSGVKEAVNNNEAINKAQLDKNIESVNNEITNKFNSLNENITNITQQVKGDALLWSKEANAFVAQHGEDKTSSKITYLLDGDISEGSTDAITGKQLYSLGDNLAAYLGGGAEYKDGKWTAPTFTLKTVKEDGTAEEKDYQNVAAAFEGVGKSFMNIQDKITNEITNEINKTKGDALLWNDEEKAFVARHEKDGQKTNSKLKYLLDGDISEGSTDAITGKQLYLMSNQLANYFGGGAGYKDGQWKEPTFYVSQFKGDSNGADKKDYHDVASAFEGVNDSMANINNRIHDVEQTVSSSGLNWNETEKAYDARHNDKDSKIAHVENGEITENSKDAVNGSQLWQTNKKVEEVESRVDNIDQQVKNIENTVMNDAVKYDKDTDGKKINKVTLAGVSESDPVVLDNVASGKINEASKEAVNGSQLWETNQKIDVALDKAKTYTDERFDSILNNTMSDVIKEAKSYTDMKFDALNYSIEGVRKEARQAAAIGLAVANLRYNETPGKLSVGFGTGLWRNQSAFAFGAGYTSESGSILSNVSVTNSGGHWGIGAGFNMTLN